MARINITKQYSFEESVEKYQMRILAMDMELKELYYDQLISNINYKKRQRHIDFLKFKLEEIKVNWFSQKGSQNIANQSFPLPAFKDCTIDEQEVCESTLLQRVNKLKSLVKYTNHLISLVQKTISGRTGQLSLTINLSKLRTKLTDIECQTHDINREKRKLDKFVSSLAKEENAIIENTKSRNGAISLFKQFFEKVNLNNSNIHQLRLKAQKEKENISWMRRWLNFQENKVSNYFNSYEIPDPILTQKLEESINQPYFNNSQIFESHPIFSDSQNSIKKIKKNLRRKFRQKIQKEVF